MIYVGDVIQENKIYRPIFSVKIKQKDLNTKMKKIHILFKLLFFVDIGSNLLDNQAENKKYFHIIQTRIILEL